MKKLAALLLLTACASAPKTTAPRLTAVPAFVVEAFCDRLRNEGIPSETPLSVLRTSRPLVSGSSLRALSHVYGRDSGEGLAESLAATLHEVPVELSRGANCAMTPIDRIDPLIHAQSTVIEFSAPFANPFAQGESGVLARMSIGGRDAQWYWIPIAEKKGILGVGMVLPTDMRD